MSEQQTSGRSRAPYIAAFVAVLMLVIGVAAGFFIGRERVPVSPAATPAATTTTSATPAPAPTERRVLYWYDPMKPEQHFDKPGRSPFMDMDLVPRYAEPQTAIDTKTASATPGVSIDARLTRNLGLRTVVAKRGQLMPIIEAQGEFEFNQRDVAKVQARAEGFVERVYGRAPGDVIARGAPLVDLMLPSWASAQQEFIAVLNLDDDALHVAARARLRLLGMDEALIARVEARRKVEARITFVSPIGGVIDALEVRDGMTVSAGTTLVSINGIDPVWLEVAVPERQADGLRVGAPVSAELAAYAGEQFKGEVTSVLPSADSTTRSLRVRASFANHDGRLHPGLSARVRINAQPGAAQLLLPSAAVIRGGQQDRVVKVGAGGHYTPLVVQLGREADGMVEILHGLNEGDTVAAAAQFLLDADASLKGFAPADVEEHTHDPAHNHREATP